MTAVVSYDKLTTERLAAANTCAAPSPSGTDRKEGGFLMPLTMAKPGETVTIRKITGRDQVKQHLAELGFVADSAVPVKPAEEEKPKKRAKKKDGEDVPEEGGDAQEEK